MSAKLMSWVLLGVPIILLPVSIAQNNAWISSRPKQCPAKIPGSSVPVGTAQPSRSVLQCARACAEKNIGGVACASFHFKDDCKMYTSTADKDCSGFVAADGKARYFELWSVSIIISIQCGPESLSN